MALFKIFNNFSDTSKNITNVSSHNTGYCYFDASTNKFYVDTSDTASGLRQLNGTLFGVCSTEADEGIKEVTIPGFDLTEGVAVFVKFTNTNTADTANLKLNVSNSGNIAIKEYGTHNLEDESDILAGMVCQFVYDGTNWIWVGHTNVNTDTTYTAGAGLNLNGT